MGPIDEQRTRCDRSRNMLRELARIHVKIDHPNRGIGADDPDWLSRLRKVCLHAVAISRCEVGADGFHAMATELRAAYVQMAIVWECMPERFRLQELDGSWWANEARTGLLATYDHPTPLSLGLPLAEGGFGDVEHAASYVRFTVWMGELGVGYGLALAYLAQVLSADGDITAQLVAVMAEARRSILTDA